MGDQLVVILSPDDSYSGLVQLSADLCRQATAHGRLTVENIDPAYLDTRTQGNEERVEERKKE